jgi:hypothetical protein
MFNHFINTRYEQGLKHRDAGILPQMQDSVYLEGYLKGRPEGLDGILQYFDSVEAYMKWKFKSDTSKI